LNPRAAAAIGLVACSPAPAPTSWIDVGDPDVSIHVDTDPLAVDAPIAVRVQFACVFGAHARYAGCTAAASDGVVTITGHAVIDAEPDTGLGTCAPIGADCTTAPLVAGDWSIVAGDRSAVFAVPGPGDFYVP
jgi:hypothetical protein